MIAAHARTAAPRATNTPTFPFAVDCAFLVEEDTPAQMMPEMTTISTADNQGDGEERPDNAAEGSAPAYTTEVWVDVRSKRGDRDGIHEWLLRGSVDGYPVRCDLYRVTGMSQTGAALEKAQPGPPPGRCVDAFHAESRKPRFRVNRRCVRAAGVNLEVQVGAGGVAAAADVHPCVAL